MDIVDYVELTFFMQQQHNELVDIMTMQHNKMLNITGEYSKQVHFSYKVVLLCVSIMYICLNNIFLIYYIKRNEQDDTDETEETEEAEVIYYMKPNPEDETGSEEVVSNKISLLCI
jgi:hypothetical protein